MLSIAGLDGSNVFYQTYVFLMQGDWRHHKFSKKLSWRGFVVQVANWFFIIGYRSTVHNTQILYPISFSPFSGKLEVEFLFSTNNNKS